MTIDPLVKQEEIADCVTQNIASHLPRMAAVAPGQAAVTVTLGYEKSGRAIYASVTFPELESLSNRYANGLSNYGFTRGMRVLVMVRPGLEFTALVFALFKMGAVPVMIDPGMGVSRLLDCVRSVDLDAFIGIPLAQLMRVLRRRSFKTVRRVVTVGRRFAWGGETLSRLARAASDSFDVVDTASDETAAILFTSGSTGPAKGVVYEHGMFIAQVDAIRDAYDIRPGEIDLPTFPLFALFSTAMGMTSVVPDMDPSHPARVDPAKIVSAIRDQTVTSTFGSPAVWRRVAAYCADRDIMLPSLRRILIAGAPVETKLIAQLHDLLSDDADVFTPYGATESLPVSSIGGREVVRDCAEKSRKGAGNCVGRSLPGIDLRIILTTDDAIERWSDDLLAADGEIGEIVVSGAVVTRAYFGLPGATALAKIRDGARLWHRIGDLGYRDDEGRIWFCGRKSHRVETPTATMYSVRCEAIFNEHPKVRRCALVGLGPLGQQRAAIVVEPEADQFPASADHPAFLGELLELGAASELTQDIADVLFRRALPVDVRHNAKIDRETLATWAAERLR